MSAVLAHTEPAWPDQDPAACCIQFHPEVTHSPKGKDLLGNFVVGICSAPTDWNMANLAEEFIEQVK